MRTFGALSACALLTLTGCSQPSSVSGIYGYTDASGAIELVLTENAQQQVMGSMSVAALQNGSIRNQGDSITGGTYDPTTGSLTLTVKPNGLLESAFNATGLVAHGAIDLTMNGTTFHLTPSNQQDFNSAVATLTNRGIGEQRAKVLAQRKAENIKTIAALTRNLNAYNTQVETNKGGPQVARAAEERIIATAQKDVRTLEAMTAQGQGNSYPASQVRFRVEQLEFQMGQVKFHVDGALQQDRASIAGFDQRLAQNPCLSNSALLGCADLAQEQQRYAKVRERIIAHEDQLMTDMQKNGTQMEALNHTAGN